MIPYIVALVFLIVIILYQVYSQTESFTASSYADLYRQRYPSMTSDASGNAVTSKDASGNPIVRTVSDSSGNDIKMSISDLFGLLGPFSIEKAKQESIKTPAPAETKPTAESAKEIEDRIVKAVSKQVKDDLLAQRATDDIHDKYAPCDLSDAEAQGQEYANTTAMPSPQPDMSEYIRKDSIPCWNCSVP